MRRATVLPILLLALVSGLVAGCGTKKAASSATPSQVTMAQVCASHEEDVGHIAAGLVAFKYAMKTRDTSSLSGIAVEVKGAVSDIRAAAVGATSANLPAMRSFLQYLQTLSEFLTTPPTHPTASAGDEAFALVNHAAEQVGCKV